MSAYNQPSPAGPLENTAGDWHNYFLWKFVNDLKTQGIVPWSRDFARYCIEILTSQSIISQEEKNYLETLTEKVFTNFDTIEEAKQQIQSYASYILNQNPGNVTKTICRICISSVQICYENNNPSANPTQLNISIPAYRGDWEGALVGAAVGGVIGAILGGGVGAIEGAAIGGISGAAIVSAFVWVYDNFC